MFFENFALPFLEGINRNALPMTRPPRQQPFALTGALIFFGFLKKLVLDVQLFVLQNTHPATTPSNIRTPTPTT
jgi:hypothetical protein